MTLKVLVVDDQKINRTILRHSLETQGHIVVTAENGKEALEKFKLESPDIVVLDVIMPVMDGFKTAPKLKELSKDVYLPIIFLTALDDQLSLTECLDVGGDDFLSKPFDQTILAAKIKAHARTRELSIKTFDQKKKLDYYKHHTEREFQVIEHIYQRALSNNYVNNDILQVHLAPAETFNGDIVLTAQGPNDNIYVLMGDFTGHGLAASIGTLPVSKAFYALTRKGLSVPDMAHELNKILQNLLPEDMFCAAIIVEFNPNLQSLTVWAGGIPDCYIINDNGVSQTITSEHMPLGILEPEEFEDDVISYQTTQNDRLLICSDGVTEQENENGYNYGEENLIELINSNPNISVQAIASEIDIFRNSKAQSDDITLVHLHCFEATECYSKKDHISKLPHHFSLELNSEQIQQGNPIDELTNTICSIKGVLRHKSNIFLLLSEAYNNALEHGVLDMDSNLKEQKDGFITYYEQRQEKLENLAGHSISIDINYCPQTRSIKMRLKDSGKGFKHTDELNEANDDFGFGRGISLMKEIANDVHYNEKGNEITIQYLLED